MPLTRKRATIWTTSDGKDFTDFVKAAEHEHEQVILHRLRELLERVHIRIDGHDYAHLNGAVQELFNNREELAKLFAKTRAVYKRESVPANVEVGPITGTWTGGEK